jgi:transcriptional regulator with XRE-family HTH domain
MTGGDTTVKRFGPVLRGWRLAAGLTQEDLAQKAGLSVRAVADIERGRTSRPYRRSVVMLAEALGLSGQDLTAFTRAARSHSASDPVARPALETRHSDSWEPVVPRQLPAAVRGFAGRSAELSTLAGLADQAGMPGLPAVITAITGIPGVGKTGLAVHWCHQVAHRFPDGQLYLNLRGFDPAAAPISPTVALHDFLEALGLPPARIPASLAARSGLYRSVLAQRAVLVLLDNAHDEAQIRPLLPGGPPCLTVITSRSPLTGLVADTGAHPIRLGVLTEEEAVELLAARLGTRRIGQDLQAAAELARLCAGLPLALSITAARAASRPETGVAALARELRTAPHLLSLLDTGDPATSPQAAFSWSHGQL